MIKEKKPVRLQRNMVSLRNNISNWNKPENREKIVKEYEAGAVDSKRKRFREGKYSDIEEALMKWFRDVRSRPNPVPNDGKILKAQAER